MDEYIINNLKRKEKLNHMNTLCKKLGEEFQTNTNNYYLLGEAYIISLLLNNINHHNFDIETVKNF